jgi:8-oxo-dGTP pyrophosphatase MutT (NUDIX family)
VIFTTLRELTAELGVEFLNDFLSEMDLWLRLENSETEQVARRELAEEIGDPAKTLRRVRLALAYDVPFNTEALQRHLTARREFGGWNPDELFAAFLIVLHSNDPHPLTDFFERYHDDLFAQEHLVRAALAGDKPLIERSSMKMASNF